MKISVKGFFLGLTIGIPLLFLTSVLIGFGSLIYLEANGGLYKIISGSDNKPLIIFSILIAISLTAVCFISGWFTAKFSAQNEVPTAISVSLVFVALAFIPYQDKGFLLTLLIATIPLPLNVFGAKMYIKRVNKVKNLRSLRSLGRAEDARPF